MGDGVNPAELGIEPAEIPLGGQHGERVVEQGLQHRRVPVPRQGVEAHQLRENQRRESPPQCVVGTPLQQPRLQLRSQRSTVAASPTQAGGGTVAFAGAPCAGASADSTASRAAIVRGAPCHSRAATL